MKAIYIRTDKNGTKIYHDYTCDRCGGLGGSDAWAYTGWKCYKCGGTGERERPAVIKEYTPEYRAKLDARRAKREEKKVQELTAQAEGKNAEFLEKQGFDSKGYCYVVLGNTYEIKDELKEAGAHYISELGWYFSHEVDYPTIKIHIDEYYKKNMYGLYSWNCVNYGEVVDATVAKIHNANKGEENKETEHYNGSVGERVKISVKYVKCNSWETHYGYRTQLQFLHSFTDSDNHLFIWKTGEPLYDIEIGAEIEIKGTIKAFDEYKGTKQTVLTRCKVEGK